jgi:tight adherence protein B
MAVILGLTFGAALLLIVTPRRVAPSARVPRSTPTWRRRQRLRLVDELTAAGIGHVAPAQFLFACAVIGLLVLVVIASVSHSVVIAVVFAAFAATAPIGLVRSRARRRRDALRLLWPDVIDSLGSAVRAGLSLPEALGQLSDRGPEPLREPFRRFADEYRVNGRFGTCLDHLKDELADPVGDRVVEALRLTRDVGGNDLGRLLRTLSGFLRDDARTRGELESRQTWTVNAARLAVAAPWILLAMLSLRPEAVDAYDSTAGLVVLAVGAVTCVAAYQLMIRLARLPQEERVLR